MSETPRQLGFREVLGIFEVRRIWLAQIVSIFGDFLAIFAVLTQVSFQFHASAAEVTGISVSFLLPFAIIGPLVGVFADRWNVKRTMIASDLARSLLAMLLFFAGGVWWIYGTLFALSIVSTFFVPSQTIAIRTVTPLEGLLSANALMQQAMQVVRIVTPALAGALVGWFGAKICYGIDSVSFLVSAALLSTVRIARTPAVPAKDSHPVRAVIDDLSAGVKYIFTHATLSFAILSIAAGLFAISCFGPLIAVYVRDELKSSELVFGIVNSLIGIGMIAGTLVTNRLARGRSHTQLVLLGLLTMGLFVLALAALKTIPGAGLGMFGIGVGVMLVVVSAQTMMQGQTPVELVGRISSSVWSLISIAQLLGLVVSGSLAHRIGITNVFYATAVLLALLAAFGYFLAPSTETRS
ncbi:MAG: MFS transporter [Blastocatellia bacterium]